MLTCRRTNHANIHVRGYNEEGTTTTPVLNEFDRFHLVKHVIDRVPKAHAAGAELKLAMQGKLFEHHAYIRVHGEDMPEVSNWQWPQAFEK